MESRRALRVLTGETCPPAFLEHPTGNKKGAGLLRPLILYREIRETYMPEPGP